MDLSNSARRKLGSLHADADRIVADVIRARGGNASNVRQSGHWADRTPGETAEAAASAATAIKIVKQARRLGERH